MRVSFRIRLCVGCAGWLAHAVTWLCPPHRWQVCTVLSRCSCTGADCLIYTGTLLPCPAPTSTQKKRQVIFSSIIKDS